MAVSSKTASITPEERRRQVALILSRAVTRHFRTATNRNLEKVPQVSTHRLEFVSDPRLSVSHGLVTQRDATQRKENHERETRDLHSGDLGPRT